MSVGIKEEKPVEKKDYKRDAVYSARCQPPTTLTAVIEQRNLQIGDTVVGTVEGRETGVNLYTYGKIVFIHPAGRYITIHNGTSQTAFHPLSVFHQEGVASDV